jgi:hypothetical protein
VSISIKRVFITTVEVVCDICGDKASVTTNNQPLQVNKELERLGWKYEYEYGQDVCPRCLEVVA